MDIKLIYQIITTLLIVASPTFGDENQFTNNQSTEHKSSELRDPTAIQAAEARPQSKEQLIFLNKPLPMMSPKLYNKANSRKRKIEDKTVFYQSNQMEWKCPNVSQSRNLECGCDIPHTLRCSGDIHGLELIANGLRQSPYSVSLLDCTLKNVSFLNDARIFENVSLHGLVISSGEIKRVHRWAFLGMKTPLLALGLPNNALSEVPGKSLAPLVSLDRLDLSDNRIKAINAVDFLALPNLTYLELSDNQITTISPRTFLPLQKLLTLKIGGNRLGDNANSLQSLSLCVNLRELDLSSNSIKGPLTQSTIPALSSLESLNLNKNLLTSIQNGALQNFPSLITLSLRHNQIDVLQDHAFTGLSSLQDLDLGYNGIVAVSGASLQHLSRLLVLNLTHNFLRSLTSDLIAPLPSLKELRLDGNDITMVSRNALDSALELRGLSLRDNPLACDCSLKPFAEWIKQSNSLSQDLLGATCATPPHLEGAPLLQIPLESLNCDGNINKYDNDVLQQLEALSKQRNLSYVKDFSDVIGLKDIHLSPDYGLILTWSVDLNSTDFSCEAVFVYKEENVHEVLMDNSPFHCESSTVGDENDVSIILDDTKSYIPGKSYRYCLVLAQTKNLSRDLVIGCSNITELKSLEHTPSTDAPTNARRFSGELKPDILQEAPKPNVTNTEVESHRTVSDIATFDKITANDEDIWLQNREKKTSNLTKGDVSDNAVRITPSTNKYNDVETQQTNYGYQLMSGISDSFLPGLGVGILLASIIVMLYGIIKMRSERGSRAAVTTCYTANDPNKEIIDCENGNRYWKLQATTTL